MKLSARARNLKPSPTLAITGMAKKLKAQGIDVVGFGAGEPDFDTPDNIKNAAIDALKNGFTKYTPAPGIEPLREAVAKKLADDNSLDYNIDNIIISSGGKHTLYNLMQVMFEAGDEVIIPAPYWVSYPPQVELADAKPVIVDTLEENGFVLTADQLEAAITPATRGLIINSPCNPTGGGYTAENLRALADVLLKHPDVMIITDDIYEKLIYDGFVFNNLVMIEPKLKDRTIIVGGHSKTYSMTGWRLGWMAGPVEIAKAVGSLQSQSTSNSTSFAQKGGVEALVGPQDIISEMLVEFDKRRLYMWDRLNQLEGIECFKPLGAFYAFPNVSALFGRKTPAGKTIESADALANYMLDDHRIAIVPGEGFGAPNNLRLSYALSMADIEKGLDRFAEAVKSLT